MPAYDQVDFWVIFRYYRIVLEGKKEAIEAFLIICSKIGKSLYYPPFSPCF